MSDKNKRPLPLPPMPVPGLSLPLADLLKMLREHPDILHLGVMLADDLDEMERQHITHMNVPYAKSVIDND